MVARELIVDVSDSERRVVWASVGGKLTHHNASAQVFAEDTGQSRLVWIADLLPNELSGVVASMIEAGQVSMKRAFARSA
jgi:hypothetical protein